MKARKKTRRGILVFALLVTLALGTSVILTSCLDPGDDGNPFVGTWTGYDQNYNRIRIVVDQSTWTASWPDYPSGYDTGTYTYSGNMATMFRNGIAIGTSTLSGNTDTVTLYGVGTYTLTKQT